MRSARSRRAPTSACPERSRLPSATVAPRLALDLPFDGDRAAPQILPVSAGPAPRALRRQRIVAGVERHELRAELARRREQVVRRILTRISFREHVAGD